MRVGFGWDSHRLVQGLPLIIGGVHIPFNKGEDGHSDGDVLTHAVIDALLGAAALGDIGSHFPPSEGKWKDAESLKLLETVCTLIRNHGYEIGNIDTTLVLEAPKFSPYRDHVRSAVSHAAGIDKSQISVKVKTAEGLDSVGSGESIEAYAQAL
ncbi:MAG: 2-C-methyl-D-erythritol 2,4-cyclodiphosphate synthase, partial [Spirochaetales bacterium]|nr:2-C-methyl-D-erythritol 2,4-cyclodiphosphate synthase [Spirochaetales bacterium]